MNKNFVRLSVLLLCFSVLTACSKNQFMDLGGFLCAFNRVSDEKIEFEGVYSYTEENDNVYETFFEDDEEGIIMKFLTENGRIKQIRVAIVKIDKNSRTVIPSAETVQHFLKITESAVRAYCSYDKTAAVSVLDGLALYNMENYKKEGELVVNDGDFSFVYYSDSFVCDFIINNRYLYATEPTEKPQSKPAYGNTTNVRGETVPLPTFKR